MGAKSGARLLALMLAVLLVSACSSERPTPNGHTVREAFHAPLIRELVEAAIKGDGQNVKELARRGADPNAISRYGDTPLAWAAYAHSIQGVNALLECGANPNQRMEGATDGWVVAEAVVVSDESEMLSSLLRHGADPNIKPSDLAPGGSLLSSAAYAGRRRNIELLLDAGADMQFIHPAYGSAAVSAVVGGKFDIAYFLLERGLSVDLDRLAATTQSTKIGRDGEADRQRVIAWLQAHKIKYPVWPEGGE